MEPAKASAALQPSIATAFKKVMNSPYSNDSPAYIQRRAWVNEFMVATMQPASLLQQPSFKRLLTGFDQRFSMHSRHTFKTDDVPAMVDSIKRKIKEKLAVAFGISITIDGWTSDGVPFMAITAHYISLSPSSHPALDSNVLALEHFPESHTSRAIDEVVGKVLSEYLPDWKTNNQVFCVTTDGASNMVAYGRNATHNYTWIRCFAHLLNRAVTDFIEKVNALPILEKLRTLRNKFKYEKAFAKKYKEAEGNGIKFRKLKRDVPTRWNSSMHMMKRGMQQRTMITIALACLEANHLNLTESEWKQCEALVRILEPFHAATEEVSSQSKVTISLPRMILEHRLETLQKHTDDDLLGSYMTLMFECLETRKLEYDGDGTVAMLGTALDPRFKHRKEALSDSTRALLEQLLDHSHPAASTNPKVISVPSPSAKRVELLFGPDQLRKEDLVHSDEILAYELEPGIDYNQDPLQWWHEKKGKCPRLFALAMRVLSAQATEVPCERLFSGAGRIFSDSRKSMHPSTLAQLVFINANHPLLVQDRTQLTENSSASESDDDM